MKEKPRHTPLYQFPLADDELVIGGIPVRQLAGQLGSTPFYVYDRAAISRRVQQLKKRLPREIRLHYAIKANPNAELARHLAALVDGMDVASVGEMRLALESGMAAEHVSFAGPGKTDEELLAAVEAGITLNVESTGELERIARQGELSGTRPNISIRVNPDFELKSSGMRMGGGAKPFGIDAERVPEVLQRISLLDLRLRGLHIYSGSQNLRADRLMEAQDETFRLAYRLAEHFTTPLELLNIGGGFGIPYFPGEQPLDLAPVTENLQQRVVECRQRLGDVEIVLELGRYLVGEAGVYVCRVIDKKMSRGTTYLVTDGGMHQHLAASGNFGQVIRKNYPVVTGHRVSGGKRENYSVVGPLCTPLDILADNLEMGAAQPGDLIAVLQSGAYGYSASPLGFLSHPLPRELLI